MAMDGVAMIHVGNMDWIIETILASSKLLTADQETTKWIYPSLNDQNSQAKFHRKTEIPFINSTIIVHSTTQYIHIYSSYSSIAPHFFLLKCNKSSFLASCRLWKSLPSISHWIMESSHQWHLVIPMVTTEKPLDIRDILVGSGWWYTMVYLP